MAGADHEADAGQGWVTVGKADGPTLETAAKEFSAGNLIEEPTGRGRSATQRLGS